MSNRGFMLDHATLEVDEPIEDTTFDFTVQDAGSFLILYTVTEEAANWAEEYLPVDAQRWNGGIVIERRYFDAIAEGILADGLTVI